MTLCYQDDFIDIIYLHVNFNFLHFGPLGKFILSHYSALQASTTPTDVNHVLLGRE